MNVTPYITSTQILHNDVVIYSIVVEEALPTHLQFVFTLEEMRENLEKIKAQKIKFAFIMDVRKLGMLSINYLQDFSKLLESYSVMFETYLVASSIFTSKNSILGFLFEIVKRFYKTKKPLKFVYSIEEAYSHIDEFNGAIVPNN
jgi:hypothetical protein